MRWALGIAVWQPAWLLVLPALAALLARRPPGWATVALPLAAGWLVATFPAPTMHGYWWPGRQVVVVLPLALVALLWWLARAGNATRTVPTVLGLAGVTAYGRLLFAGLAGEMTWTSASTGQGTPGTAGYQAVRPLLLDYRAFQLASSPGSPGVCCSPRWDGGRPDATLGRRMRCRRMRRR